MTRSIKLVTGICRFRTEHKFGVTELAHLRNIETRQLRFYRNSLPHEELKGEVDNEAECEDKAHQRGYTDQLRSKLAGITVEQAGDRAGNAVPASTVVAGAVCEEPY